MPTRFRTRIRLFSSLALALAALACTAAGAQSAPAAPENALPPLTVGLTYDATGSSLITTNSFWLQGGAIDVSGNFYRGWGDTTSILGLHSGNSGQGVPVNMVVATFGPRYSFPTHLNHHPMVLFTQALVGEAFGFSGLYPSTAGPLQNANSLAVQAGGGADLYLAPHISFRLLQVDYLYTRLPNSSLNYQNNIRLGAGIVFHKAPRAAR